MDVTLKAQDWKPLSQCLAILTSREDWVEKIIDAWMRIEEEDYKEIRTMLEQERKGESPVPSVDDVIVFIAENRGSKRIAVLRLISTLTHAAESCCVSNAEIESLLYIAYTASHRILREEECRTQVEYLLHVERSVGHNVFRIGSKRRKCPEMLFKIGDESVLGPSALARLLVVLAQRRSLETIQGMKKPPNGLSSCTSLHQVQQITHLAVIRRFLTIALARMMACTQQGRNYYTQGRYTFARILFTSSAELAAALIALDSHTEGQYSEQVRGARKELVIALGNASETALKLKEPLKAESFGLGAISASENIPASEGLDPDLLAKNHRRVYKAQTFSRNS
ncbi:hypothetical protein J3A83DRAFT_4392195 [Scleroderma citrinum]